jgi:cyclophilin family peptidyl-prolyl cis-trans isomerase
MRILAILAVVCLTAALLPGCQPKPEPPAGDVTPSPNEPPLPTAEAPAPAEPAEKQAEEPKENPVVVIETTKGDIVVELYADAAPKTVANFLALAKEGYYDDMPWHRCEPGFVIQTGRGSQKPTIPDEVNAHKHRPGALAMAKPGSMGDPSRLSAPDSASSQFYVTLCEPERAKHLNTEFTVFGQVTEGLEVAGKITTADKITAIKPKSDG